MDDTGNRTGVPLWPAAYLAGLQVGYWTRIGEENERWRAAVSRLDVVEADVFVTIDGRRERVWTWRDRETDRLATLREGHGAGLHDGRPAYGCPGCGR